MLTLRCFDASWKYSIIIYVDNCDLVLIKSLVNRLTSYLEGYLSLPQLIQIEILIRELRADIKRKDDLYSEWATIEIAYTSALDRAESSEETLAAGLSLSERDLDLIRDAITRMFTLLDEHERDKHRNEAM
jgi:hypothetical protein